ncbi:MAG: undecaprenyl-phosphate glucose phosphotransferase [Burkholderiales bacterium]|nr:undecaprenyl-phosphate glucose phosphotransferase [Burkholderiales bacterium]
MALYEEWGRRRLAHDLRVQAQTRGGKLELTFATLAVAFDVGVIVACSAGATALYSLVSGVNVDISRSRESALVIAALFVTMALRDGAYRTRCLTMPNAAWIATKWAIAVALFLVIAFLFRSGAYYSRGVILFLAPIGFVGLLASRHIVARALWQAIDSASVAPLKLAVIGADGETESLVRARVAEDPHLDVVSYVRLSAEADCSATIQSVLTQSQNGQIDEILVALPWARMKQIETVVAQLRQQALPVLLLPDVETVGYISRPVQLGTLPTFEVKRSALSSSELFLKRSMDIAIAGGALLVLWPVLLAAAIAIKLESPGPVFFRQHRHGFNSRKFLIYKFRSMRVTEDGAHVKQAVRHDPRITRVGAFLRRTSIDELPQLINVIRGEMSIVGPRPHAVAHNEEWVKLVEGYARRHNILPGLTGLAQVSGFRGETDTQEKIDSRVRLDLQYVESWSLTLDIKIIFKTVAVLFFQDEAY